MVRIVGLPGSLRAGSANALLLQLALSLVPTSVEAVVYEGIGGLPHFNPDLDQEGATPPPPVAELRALLGSASGFIFSVPEYAHGLPGAFKNALDWIVSSGELVERPVLLLNASAAGGQYAQANLVETVTIMGGRVLPESLIAPFLQQRLAPGMSLDGSATATLRHSVDALLSKVSE